jgi:DNA adenine methylase
MLNERGMQPVRAPLEPLIKWPGGKRALLKYLIPLIPEKYDRYFEPFLGGGALFFALRPSQAILSDKNHDLMNCYIQLRDQPEDVIERLGKLKNTKEDYYRKA